MLRVLPPMNETCLPANKVVASCVNADFNLVPRALFPSLGGGAGKGPGIGRSHDHQTPRICGCTKLAYDRIR